MTTASPLGRLTDELLMFLQEAAERETSVEAAATLRLAKQEVLSLRRRLQLASCPRYVVAVVGQSNVGKSTLLNALFGQKLAPTRNGPCTAIPIEFTAGSSLRIIQEFKDDFRRQAVSCESVPELGEQLDRLANDPTGTMSQRLRRVVVELSHPLLVDGLVISDTPGFAAAQGTVADGIHEAGLREYLLTQVAQVFLVTTADQGIGRTTLRFHESMLADVCDDVVFTGCEDWSDRDTQRFQRRFSGEFGHRAPNFHFVSSIEGLGIEPLARRIRSLADIPGRLSAVTATLRMLIEDIGEWRREYNRDRVPAHQPLVWPPDSWHRLMAAPDSDGLKQTIRLTWE